MATLNYPTLVDCGCSTRVYGDGSGVEIDYCDMHRAAPDLYDAAKLALEYFDQCVMSCDDPETDVPEAAALRAAIANADGKETPDA